jgi:drug/metabolite transporter (DMT)-like permease
VINQIFFIKGVSLTTPIHSSLLSLATPIFITIIAAWLLREGFTWIKFMGLVLGIGGAAMLILLKDAAIRETIFFSAILWYSSMLSLIHFTWYLSGPLMKTYSGIQVLRWIFTFGSLVILPFGMQEFASTNWSAFDLSHWVALAFVAVGATFLAYLLNVYGISVIGASATALIFIRNPFSPQ